MATSKALEKLGTKVARIAQEPHLSVVRDALVTVVPFLVLGGFAAFFSAVLFAETSPLAAFVDPSVLASIATIFTRIGNGTTSLLSIYLVMSIPYFLGNNRGFSNPQLLAMTGIATFFVFTPLAGGSSYYGTNGVLLSILLGLGSAELFMKLSTVKALKWNIRNVPEVVGRSFSNLFVIVITVSAFALVAGLMNILSGLEAIELIYSVLQQPLMTLGCSIPGAIIYHIIGGLGFTLGIHPAGILSPLDTAYIAAVGTDTIINYSFIYTFAMMGGCGCCMALVINLFRSRRSDLRSVAKMTVFPEIFNISEPVTFGLPIVFNFTLLIPMILVPIVNTLIAYAATVAGFVPVLDNMIVWSMPVFVKGFVASGGNLMVTVLEAVLFVLDIFLWMPFVKVHERSLDDEDEKARFETAAE